MPKRVELELPVRIRQSSLTDARCLYHYQQHHIKGIRKGDSEASVRGTHFHKAAKDYVDHLVETGQYTHYAKAEEIAKSYPDSQGIINRWCERSIFYPERIYATEFNILLDWDFKPVPPDTPIKYSPYSGTLDRVEMMGDIADIYDYKTNRAVFDVETIQTVYYPWLLSKVFPHLTEIKFHLDFVRFGVIRDRTFSKDELQFVVQPQIEGWESNLLEAIENNHFPAMGGHSTCNYCQLECPLVTAGLDEKAVVQVKKYDDATSMAETALTMRKRSAKMMQALKHFASKEDTTIELTEEVLDFHLVEKWKYDRAALMKLNEQYGLDPLNGLAPSKQALKKTFRRYPEFERDLQGASENRSHSEFEFKKKPSEGKENG